VRKKSAPIIILLVIVTLAALLLLVTSVPNLANAAAFGPPAAAHPQQNTPTPTEADGSVAGSTDGIVWMGIVIALIVLLPLLLNRTIWTRET
jgi:hypothetical protein